MTLINILPFALLGAVIGLDVVSFPQAMISRPLVSATLAGALAGNPGGGLLAGATLELFALESLPVGASRYPEWGTAGVVGGTLFAIGAGSPAGVLSVAVLGALITAEAGAWSMIIHRKQLGRWAAQRRDALASGSPGAVTTLQLRGLTADLVRGGVLTFLALALFVPLARWSLSGWGLAPAISRAVVVSAAMATGAGAVWMMARATDRARWFLLAGLVAGFSLQALT